MRLVPEHPLLLAGRAVQAGCGLHSSLGVLRQLRTAWQQRVCVRVGAMQHARRPVHVEPVHLRLAAVLLVLLLKDPAKQLACPRNPTIVEQDDGLGDLTAKRRQGVTAFACPRTDVAPWCTLGAVQPGGIARRALQRTLVHRTPDVYWTDARLGLIYRIAKG
jgi:hypothetical protein